MNLVRSRCSALALSLALSLGVSSCISKGDTQINNNGEKVRPMSDADGGATSNASPDPTTADEGTDEADESAEETVEDDSETPVDDEDGTATSAEDSTGDDDGELSTSEDEPTQPEVAPTDDSSDPSPPETDTAEDTPDAAVDETSSDTTEPAPPAVATERCSPASGRPSKGESVMLTDGDYVDKLRFDVAAGPSEHFISWIDVAATEVHTLTLGAEVSQIDVLEIDQAAALRSEIAAVYSPEEDAYATTWSGGAQGADTAYIAFNWIKGGAWVDDPHFYGTDLTPGYAGAPMGIAYDGDNYAIAPAAQHPYGIIVSPLGSGTVQGPAGTHFTRIESRDIVSMGEGKFATLGHYHDGSVNTRWETLNIFDAAGEATSINTTVAEVFAGATSGDNEPKGTQLVWLGGLFGVVYGDTAGALHYATLTPAGVVASNDTLVMGQWPLDAYYDETDQLLYILATTGEDVTFMAIDPSDATVVLDNRGVAEGADVTDGFLLWDELEERHRAYFSAQDGNLHQIFTSVVSCEAAE